MKRSREVRFYRKAVVNSVVDGTCETKLDIVVNHHVTEFFNYHVLTIFMLRQIN